MTSIGDPIAIPGSEQAERLDTAPRETVALPTVRAVGIALAVSAPIWAVVIVLYGDVVDFGWRTLLGGVTALAFQSAVVGLLRVEERARAMTRPGSSGTVATIGFRVEYVLMAGAMVSTVLDGFALIEGTVVWAVFDACWPLSMLGMVIIGARVAIVGRWQGALRWQTLFAQSWFVWGIPAMAFGTVGTVVMISQVVLGYGVLGGLLAAKPGATTSDV
ncbi:hypothetical protein SAMN04488550_2231 [Gordonia malaquae]|uniref:Uncharacterized protein n=1 Tax=Gordonia malaquae NBRC 108250 TaxID=1223542 RepID=M3TDB9_GORML|nr:hypothetical protein [Gordonia malaquae]GAC79426.1 hypothetical protein GM1_010_00140 [Gordonia malaquae NBRC 108250]SED26993.1 hypothetical protein SAMN04488550_2231 [Gordonia malaquae]